MSATERTSPLRQDDAPLQAAARSFAGVFHRLTRGAPSLRGERTRHAPHDRRSLMNHFAPNDRPREKLAQSGAGVLGNNELLAVLIGHGQAGSTAIDLANRVLSLSGGIHGLATMQTEQLARAPGIGPARASRILAAVELGRRTLLTAVPERPRFRSPREAADHLLPQFGAYPVERFGVMLLDTRHRLISSKVISIGSLDASMAHPREVFREAVTAGAAAIIAFHNHPSGDPAPSRDDVLLTARLRSAGSLLGVDLVDHVILAETTYCSMKERGLI